MFVFARIALGRRPLEGTGSLDYNPMGDDVNLCTERRVIMTSLLHEDVCHNVVY